MSPNARPEARPYWALILGAMISFVACGDESTLSPVRPRLVAEPAVGSRIDFGTVVLTRTSADEQTIFIKNEGDGVLTLDPPRLSGQGAGEFEIVAYPRQVAPGGQSRIVIRYLPVSPGTSEVTMAYGTNDPDQRDVSWTLTGVAREPCLLYADQSRIFFNVGDRKALTLISLTTNECVIDRISLDRRIFPIVDEPELPLVIQGGGSLTLEVEHRAISSRQPGAPVRELKFYETEGGTISVLLEGEPPLFGCLEAMPTEIVLPETQPGQERNSTVTVTNRCGKAASIVSTVVSRAWDAFTVTAPSDYPTTVQPGSSVPVRIRYTPVRGTGDYGMVIINTNDAANPQFRIEINGRAAVPDITYFPTSLDFGSVIYRSPSMAVSECSSASRSFQIHSTGSAPLRVDRLEVDPARDGDFRVTGVSVDGTPIPVFDQGFVIPVGKKAEVTMQFHPVRTTPNEHIGRLLIHHNGDTQPAPIELLGNASPDGPAADSFTQLEGPKVDILWVIDNSCSMYDEQARLIQNLSRFVDYADSLGSDYQMAVTVTDSRSPEAGVFNECWPHPRIIRHDYPDREAAFRCMFEVGTNGSYLEAGLGAAYQAILKAQDNRSVNNPNAGFLRPDASLAIVAMSDEEDQSVEDNELLRDFYWSVKGARSRTPRVRVHSIAGPTTSVCQMDPRIAPGYRYEWMSNQTGGLFFSICSDDWAPVLESLGLSTFTPIDEWQLSQAAVPASVTVTVEGIPVPWSTSNGFTYDVTNNTVKFYGASVPGPGERIDVSYLGNCQP